ncbi:MAG: tetraacyldisaccharide 4'-kinase [Calditrichaceae bacterium]|nr:tetraacyldisaccharide 4'-kinase [Calditrichaceae bacterium]MBN2709215.1 tetraacyldisaccharide 4'-kinase [Calditrichaceae bacterium]RQV96168.1 MAG: tetraacyldisaccharide 4'-kinase [Calditrichota bacterium]
MKYLIGLLKIIVIPFALLYGLIIEIRNILYDLKIMPITKYAVPVISVGNLTVGGTGKTPFIIMLSRLLNTYGKRIAIVSRGYGRKSRGAVLVSDGENILAPADISGDEPQLIARKLPFAIVAVAEKRKQAIDMILAKFQPQVILMDDGFQHRSVHRDMDIVLWNVQDHFYFNLPLPSGNLREFQYRIKRSDFIFLTKSGGKSERIKLETDIPLFEVKSGIEKLMSVEFKEAGRLSSLKGKRVAAFAGLAHPEEYETMLREAGVDLVFFKKYKDHHDYSIKEVDGMITECIGLGAEYLLCTEKDMIKIRPLKPDIPENFHLLCISLEMEIVDGKIFLEKLRHLVDRQA